MDISNRINEMQYSAIRKLNPFAQKAKESGKKVYHLNIGAPDVHTPVEFFDAIKNFNQETLSYAPSLGLDELRVAMSDYYDNKFSKDEIIITAGASEALLFTLLTCCNPGDEIVTADPYYSNYNSYLKQADVSLSTFPTKREEAFSFPSKEVIEKSISSKTKALLICNPANPTGAVLSKDEIETIIQIAEEKDLYIIADEIYRDFIYDGQEYISFADYEDASHRVIILDSISKRFSACGARIGAIMSKNKDFMSAIAKVATARLAVSTLEQVGTAALYKMNNSYLKEVNDEYRERRDLVYNMLSEIEGVDTYKSEGAFYTIVGLPVEDADEFAKWLLTDFNYENETVMIAPASGFYNEEGMGKNEARIAFAISQEDIKRAINLLEIALKEYNK